MRTKYDKKTNGLKSSYIPLIKLNLNDKTNIFKAKYNTINYDPYFVNNS